MGDGGMKIYQLMAHGNLATFESSHKIHSQKVYGTEEQAKRAIPKFMKMVTTPRNIFDLMTLDKEGLEITVLCLNLISNKKEDKENEK